MEYKYRSKILDDLGVRSWINARNWSTVVGGSWIDDRVLDAMNEVAKTFVDAALLPVGNLKKFIDMGADIVCFSGGKAIKAPNNTGFMIGKGKGADIIKGIRNHTFPHPGWGVIHGGW